MNRLTLTLLSAVLVPAFLLAAPAAITVAGAQPVGHPLVPPTYREHRAARYHRGSQIACTVSGCHHIPPRCHPEMGYDINGDPTGFDIVVCP